MLPGVGNCFRMKISRVQPSNSNSMIRFFWQHITMFFGPLLSLGTFPFLDRTGFPDSPCFFTSTRTGMFVWPRVNSNVQFIPPWRVPAKYLPLDDTKHHPQTKHKLKKIIVLLPGAFANNSHISHNKDVFWVVRLVGDPRRVLWSMDINTFYLNNMNTLIISYGLDSIYGNVHLKPPDRPPWFLVCEHSISFPLWRSHSSISSPRGLAQWLSGWPLTKATRWMAQCASSRVRTVGSHGDEDAASKWGSGVIELV